METRAKGTRKKPQNVLPQESMLRMRYVFIRNERRMGSRA